MDPFLLLTAHQPCHPALPFVPAPGRSGRGPAPPHLSLLPIHPPLCQSGGTPRPAPRARPQKMRSATASGPGRQRRAGVRAARRARPAAPTRRGQRAEHQRGGLGPAQHVDDDAEGKVAGDVDRRAATRHPPDERGAAARRAVGHHGGGGRAGQHGARQGHDDDKGPQAHEARHLVPALPAAPAAPVVAPGRRGGARPRHQGQAVVPCSAGRPRAHQAQGLHGVVHGGLGRGPAGERQEARRGGGGVARGCEPGHGCKGVCVCAGGCPRASGCVQDGTRARAQAHTRPVARAQAPGRHVRAGRAGTQAPLPAGCHHGSPRPPASSSPGGRRTRTATCGSGVRGGSPTCASRRGRRAPCTRATGRPSPPRRLSSWRSSGTRRATRRGCPGCPPRSSARCSSGSTRAAAPPPGTTSPTCCGPPTSWRWRRSGRASPWRCWPASATAAATTRATPTTCGASASVAAAPEPRGRRGAGSWPTSEPLRPGRGRAARGVHGAAPGGPGPRGHGRGPAGRGHRGRRRPVGAPGWRCCACWGTRGWVPCRGRGCGAPLPLGPAPDLRGPGDARDVCAGGPSRRATASSSPSRGTRRHLQQPLPASGRL